MEWSRIEMRHLVTCALIPLAEREAALSCRLSSPPAGYSTENRGRIHSSRTFLRKVSERTEDGLRLNNRGMADIREMLMCHDSANSLAYYCYYDWSSRFMYLQIVWQ